MNPDHNNQESLLLENLPSPSPNNPEPVLLRSDGSIHSLQEIVEPPPPRFGMEFVDLDILSTSWDVSLDILASLEVGQESAPRPYMLSEETFVIQQNPPQALEKASLEDDQESAQIPDMLSEDEEDQEEEYDDEDDSSTAPKLQRRGRKRKADDSDDDSSTKRAKPGKGEGEKKEHRGPQSQLRQDLICLITRVVYDKNLSEQIKQICEVINLNSTEVPKFFDSVQDKLGCIQSKMKDLKDAFAILQTICENNGQFISMIDKEIEETKKELSAKQRGNVDDKNKRRKDNDHSRAKKSQCAASARRVEVNLLKGLIDLWCPNKPVKGLQHHLQNLNTPEGRRCIFRVLGELNFREGSFSKKLCDKLLESFQPSDGRAERNLE